MGFLELRKPVSVTLAPGDARNDIDLRLVPQAVITGRVLDEDGDPISGVFVSAMQFKYSRGHKLLKSSGAAGTNDIGEFRFPGLQPGKYILQALANRSIEYDRSHAGIDSQREYPPTYYPSALQAESAVPLNVTAGSQLRGIDITLVKVPSMRIRGHVLDPAKQPVSDCPVVLEPRGMVSHIKDDGTFGFHGVQSGSYVLTSYCTRHGIPMAGRLTLEVGNTSVDGIVIPLGPSPEITGRIVMDGKMAVPPKLNVNLDARTQEAVGTVAEDGSFFLGNLSPEEYEVNVGGLPKAMFVKSIKLGDTDVTETDLDFTQGVPAAQFVILLSAAGGQVEGVVQDDNQKPVVGAEVVLVPEPSKRSVFRLFRTSTSDENGHYSINGIAPGEYKLFAWADIEDGAYQDPDVLKLHESRGEAVTVKENSSETEALIVIP
jgi:hypothetical protein